MNWRYLQIRPIWRYLQFIWRYLQINCRYLQIGLIVDISNWFEDIFKWIGDICNWIADMCTSIGDIFNSVNKCENGAPYTSTQSAYSNIERKTLAIVNGVTKFHTYLFGKPFVITTDHKPLLMIHSKPLHEECTSASTTTPGQNAGIRLSAGVSNWQTDDNRRCPLKTSQPGKERWNSTWRYSGRHHVGCRLLCSIDMINFSIIKRVQLREMSTPDRTLRALQRVLSSEWPSTIKDLPKDLRPYWSYRDEISISDGVIFKGSSYPMHWELSDILRQLHEAHHGIEKTRLLMRESVYWPHIYRDIKMMVKWCAVCYESQTEHR